MFVVLLFFAYAVRLTQDEARLELVYKNGSEPMQKFTLSTNVSADILYFYAY